MKDRFDWVSLLEGIQALLLGSAVVVLFLRNDLLVSNALVLGWLALALLLRRDAHPWSFLMLGLLMLNVRGVVLDEAPLPVSPVDYMLMLAAFLCGHGRRQGWWFRQASILSLATLIGVLIHLDAVVDFAIFGIEYHIAALTKNQTAMLAGLACLASLVGLLAFRSPLSRLAHSIALTAAALLLRAADSRAGLGMAILSVLLAGVILMAPVLVATGRRKFGSLRRPLLIGAAALSAFIVVVWLLLQQTPDLGPSLGVPGIDRVYGEENLENDVTRLKLWGCYLGIPFTGSNRFIWGVGYQNAWMMMCTAKEVGRPLSHAHNLVLQVWAENGVVGALFLLSWLGWILGRMVKNARLLKLAKNSRMMVFASSCLVIYLIGFHLFELGMVKIPLLLFFFGLFLASPFFSAAYIPPGSPIVEHQS